MLVLEDLFFGNPHFWKFVLSVAVVTNVALKAQSGPKGFPGPPQRPPNLNELPGFERTGKYAVNVLSGNGFSKKCIFQNEEFPKRVFLSVPPPTYSRTHFSGRTLERQRLDGSHRELSIDGSFMYAGDG